MAAAKLDHPPLLGPGRHEVSRRQLFELFVRGRDPIRLTLHYSLMRLFSDLKRLDIQCEVWVDGSFVCDKKAPSDIDVVLVVWYADVDSFSDEAVEFLKLHSDEAAQKYDDAVDLFVCLRYPRDHVDYGLGTSPEDWAEQFGTENSNLWLKGFAVVPSREVGA